MLDICSQFCVWPFLVQQTVFSLDARTMLSPSAQSKISRDQMALSEREKASQSGESLC